MQELAGFPIIKATCLVDAGKLWGLAALLGWSWVCSWMAKIQLDYEQRCKIWFQHTWCEDHPYVPKRPTCQKNSIFVQSRLSTWSFTRGVQVVWCGREQDFRDRELKMAPLRFSSWRRRKNHWFPFIPSQWPSWLPYAPRNPSSES